ncbi:MAG: NUDIX hydrolase [Lachnospiraceae bacterium]
MKLISLKKVKDGKYLKNYELTYLNKAGKEKAYEIVSRKELKEISDLGKSSSGLSIIATCGDKLLLLHEFRMGVNKRIYNLCAGMLEDGETVEECITRELYEETGLQLKKINKILPASFSAVAISDIKTNIAFVEVDGEISDHSSSNEDIEAGLYSREEVAQLLATEEFSSRAQIAAYFFSEGRL